MPIQSGCPKTVAFFFLTNQYCTIVRRRVMVNSEIPGDDHTSLLSDSADLEMWPAIDLRANHQAN